MAMKGGGSGDADDFDEEFGGLDAVDTVAEDNATEGDDHGNRNNEEKSNAPEHERIRDKISDVAEEGLTREQLMDWLVGKMEDLHKAKKLAVHGVSWSDAGPEQERKAIMRMGFIFLTYQPSVWWFEILVMMQKLTMTAGVIFIFQGTAIQVAAAFFITFGFLIFVLWYRPLVNGRLMQLQVFSLVITCLTLFFGLMKMTPAGYKQALVRRRLAFTMPVVLERARGLSAYSLLFLILLCLTATAKSHSLRGTYLYAHSFFKMQGKGGGSGFTEFFVFAMSE